jgi:periplasmic divalent cation tolerance protein
MPPTTALAPASAAQALVAVFTTVGSHADAQGLARTLVERRLVACAQIDQISSVYRWQGEVQQEPEWRLMMKTTQGRSAAAQQALREMHPYALPAIYALPLEQVLPAYAQWVAEAVADDPAAPDSPGSH